jgi:excisionase family DNA binding protein
MSDIEQKEKNITPIFLTLDETAEILQLPKTRVYQLVRDRSFPAHKFGTQWRIHREKLEEWARRSVR